MAEPNREFFDMDSKIVAVSLSAKHGFSKENTNSISLIEDFGIEGDVHAGKKVKHIFLAKKDPTRRNIRQVHLIAMELLDEVANKGFLVNPGQLGENITTQGIDLIKLPVATQLHIGDSAVIEVTALRNPCPQINHFQKGLLKEMAVKDPQGKVVRKAGVMGVVLVGGTVKPTDHIKIALPALPHQPLEYIW